MNYKKLQKNTNKVRSIIIFIYFFMTAIEGYIILLSTFINQTTSVTNVIGLPTRQVVFYLFIFTISTFLFLISILIITQASILYTFLLRIKPIVARFPNPEYFLIILIGSAYIFSVYYINRFFGINNKILEVMIDPINTWFFLICFQSIVLLLLISVFKTSPRFSLRFFIITGSIFLTWLILNQTGIGLLPDNRYWNVAGVPVLAIQFVGIILISILLDSLLKFLLRKMVKTPDRAILIIDVVLCLILWGTATYLWINAPFGHSFFARGPTLPNNDFHPYSDAALMDLGGQYMIIGEGLNYPFFTEKALYVFFLGLLHFFAGQSYSIITAIQIGVFATFPLFMFLLGNKFGGRAFGIMVALFAIIKERNALESTFQISVSNSRLFMSEFPTGLVLLAFSIPLFMWFRIPHNRFHLILIAGGLLGFSSMIRTTPLVIIPFVFLVSIFLYKFKWKQWLISCLIFLMGFVFAVGPWAIYDQVVYGANSYTGKIIAVWNLRISGNTQISDPSIIKGPQESMIGTLIEKSKIVSGHFFNNEIKSLFTLPFMIYPQDLKTILKEPFWIEPIIWKGYLPFSAAAAFALNLGLIALGINYAWSKWRFAGLVPLIVNIGYHFANALGRTSGSRYLLPVDWTFYFYYCFGLLFILFWIIKARDQALEEEYIPTQASNLHISKNKYLPTIISSLVILIFGSLLPIIDSSFPKKYPPVSNQEILYKLENTNFYQTTQLKKADVSEFLQTGGGRILFGRILYPSYETLEITSNRRENGLFLTLLTPEIHKVFIQMENPPNHEITGGSDAIIIGCQHNGYIYGLYVYLFNDPISILEKSSSLLTCESP